MEFYHRKPLTVKAVQFDGSNASEVADILDDDVQVSILQLPGKNNTPPNSAVQLRTDMRTVSVPPGNWVLVDPEGNFYQKSPARFAEEFVVDTDRPRSEEASQ